MGEISVTTPRTARYKCYILMFISILIGFALALHERHNATKVGQGNRGYSREYAQGRLVHANDEQLGERDAEVDLLLQSKILTPISDASLSEETRIQKLVWAPTSAKCVIVFVKVPKCASSTVGGLSRRIATRYDENYHYIGIHDKRPSPSLYKVPTVDLKSQCILFAGHYPQPDKIAQVKDISIFDTEFKQNKLLLFSFIREPDSRIMSQLFHFHISRGGHSPDDETVIDYLSRHYKEDFITHWLGGFLKKKCSGTITAKTGDGRKTNAIKKNECIDKIVDNYDFIGVVERMDESLIVFKNLLNLTWEDMIHVGNSKTNGGYDDLGFKIVPTTTSEAVTKYLEDQDSIPDRIDWMLYQRVNKTLSNTIALIGSEKVRAEVVKYRLTIKAANEYCNGRVFFPFDGAGNEQKAKAKQDCYWNDNGCGIPCIDEFIRTEHFKSISTL